MKKGKILTIVSVVVLQFCSGCGSMNDYDTSYNYGSRYGSSLRNSQKANYDPFGLNLNFLTDVSYGHSSVPQDLPENWESRFEPWWGPPMDTDKHESNVFWDGGIEIEPTLKIGDWHLGIPISERLTIASSGGWFVRDKLIAYTTLDWWDKVTIMEAYLRNTGPSIGISVGKEPVYVQFSWQEYKIYVEDFYGVDVWGGINYSKFLAKRDIDEGWGQRIDVYYVQDEGWSDRSYGCIGLFYAKYGDVWFAGIGLKFVYGVLY